RLLARIQSHRVCFTPKREVQLQNWLNSFHVSVNRLLILRELYLERERELCHLFANTLEGRNERRAGPSGRRYVWIQRKRCTYMGGCPFLVSDGRVDQCEVPVCVDESRPRRTVRPKLELESPTRAFEISAL